MGVIEESYKDGVFTLTLNRPEKKNAMSLEFFEALYGSLLSARDKEASVVVIRGAGKTFSSGGDVIEFMESEDPAARVDSMADFLNRSIVQIRRMPAIVIAVVEGLAVGAGLSLSLACDLTLASRKASMNLGYRKIGLTPDGGGSLFLPRLAGMKRFNELFFLSRSITMDEARDLGLVNFVVNEEELEEKLAALVSDLKAQPQETTARAKELVNRTLWQGLEGHLDKERFFVADFAAKPRFQNRLKELFKKK
jgi:2-(1,2-epoxy-1,2-dihydrophenyl)acetyl-CoA isomerase